MPDHPLERHEQAARADRQEARQQLGHLDAREPLLAGLRVADEQSEAEREPGDVRERLARARRRAASAPGRSRCRRPARAPPAPPARGPRSLRRRFPAASSAGRRWRFQSFACSAASAKARSRISASAACGVSPSGERTATPAATWSIRPGHPDHEELVHVRGEDRAEVDALEQRHRVVADDLEHPPVEVELRQLPVQEPRLRLGGARSHDRLSSRARRGPWVTKVGPSGYGGSAELSERLLVGRDHLRGQRRELQLRPEASGRGRSRSVMKSPQRLRLARASSGRARSVKVEIG